MSVPGISDRLVPRELAVLSLIGGVTALVAVVYWDSYLSMMKVWQSTQYGHGMLVFPVVAWLLWRIRQRLAEVELGPCPWGIAPMVLLILSWYVGAATGVQIIEQLAAVLLIPVTILAVLGWPLTRSALFPLLFTTAAVPIGDGLLPYLMQITAVLSTTLLQVFGVPVFREGQYLSLPGGEFEIADVCAGMQYLTAGTIIALLFSYLTYRSYFKRALFVAAMVVAMVVTNSVRAFVVMLVASATDMRYFVGTDHVYFGWILFAVVIAIAIYVAGRFGDREDAEPAAAPAPQRRAPLVSYRGFGSVSAVGGALLVLGSGPVAWASRPDVAHSAPPALALRAVEGCEGPGPWAAGAPPKFEGPDAAVSGAYWCSAVPVNVFVAVYLDNTQGREVVSRSNRLIADTWRRTAAPELQSFAAADGRTIVVNELQLDLAGARWLAWYWYEVGGDTVTSGVAVKLKQALQMVIEGQSDGSVHLLQTPLDGSTESSRQRLADAARTVADL